ncbi:MAG: shikimate kinase [Candidatus Aminicenantes bacterium]|jgi:shikimate dehydrogenase
MKDRMNKEKRLAVTGNPILHSKSPLMFNAVFQLQSKDKYYSYTRLAASSAEEAIFLFKELRLTGMNVTAPFKKDIIDQLDTIEAAAARIGGVNTVFREGRGLKGCNTDYIGVIESLKQNNVRIKDKRCIVLGAGGAGGAAIYGLAQEKAEVIVLDQDFQRSREAAVNFGGRAEKVESLGSWLSGSDILISAIPADADIIPETWLRKDLVVFDANYKKSFLSEKAKKRGCKVIKGEEWLLNQAIPAYRYFLGTTPDQIAIEAMRTALLSAPPAKPKNIALVGFMGCGKTAIGQLLAKKMGLIFKDTDDLIEAREGRTIPEIFKTDGEAYFRKVEKAILKQELENHTGVVYGCGGGVVLDEKNKKILKTNALVVWLYSSIETTLKRIPPGTRPLLDCPHPGKKARDLLDQRLNHYSPAADLIVSSEKSIEKTAGKIHEEISKAFGD